MSPRPRPVRGTGDVQTVDPPLGPPPSYPREPGVPKGPSLSTLAGNGVPLSLNFSIYRCQNGTINHPSPKLGSGVSEWYY